MAQRHAVMLRMKCLSVTILCLCVCAGSLEAQKAAHNVPSPSAVVAISGSYQLTDEMIRQALRFGEFLADANFSQNDATALRGDLIATFQKEPAKQMESYVTIGTSLREAPGLQRNPSWLATAVDRYKAWQWYAENPPGFREFQSYPFGKMVLKYNPVLVNFGGMIVTRVDVECQFYSDALVAKAAG